MNIVPGGDLERALLVVLWDKEPATCTARDLHDAVGKPRGIVYTTVAKVLDRMVEKKLVKRERIGRSYAYRALVGEIETRRSVVRMALHSVLGDDPKPAVAALLGALEDVSPDLLDELEAQIKARRGGKSDGT